MALERSALRVGIVGCGRVGAKRAAALGADVLVAVLDVERGRAEAVADGTAARVCTTLDDVMAERPDVVVVATTHDALARIASQALAAGAHVLAEKPAGRTPAEVDALIEAEGTTGRRVKVGFNHRFHPAISRAVTEARSGRHGDVMFMRARYGHGGRLGYEQEWRARPELSGGGELLDQGLHVLDLSLWLHGPLPLHSALIRTNFWDMPVEDNAVVTLGEPDSPNGPWSLFHVSCSEWKNIFSLEIYCRTAKLEVSGLHGSYGRQVLRIFRMRPELGPPDVEEIAYSTRDESWVAEWDHLREALRTGAPFLGDLAGVRYGLAVVTEAYRRCAYPFELAVTGRPR